MAAKSLAAFNGNSLEQNTKRWSFSILLLTLLSFSSCATIEKVNVAPEVVTFKSGTLTLKGLLYKPAGEGPFPAVLYNHGSAPGMLSNQAAERIGPLYVKHGWIFFMPYRRGQGLSESAGQYIMDQVVAVEKTLGTKSAAETLTRLLTTEHLEDQLAALTWLKKTNFVKPDQITVAGNSFGGIQTVLGVEKGFYCAGIDAAGAAQSWASAPHFQKIMIQAAQQSRAPIFFFQAENDFDLSLSKVLSAAMIDVYKISELKIYPAFGKSQKDGHAFAYMGEAIWEGDVFKFLKKHCEK